MEHLRELIPGIISGVVHSKADGGSEITGSSSWTLGRKQLCSAINELPWAFQPYARARARHVGHARLSWLIPRSHCLALGQPCLATAFYQRFRKLASAARNLIMFGFEHSHHSSSGKTPKHTASKCARLISALVRILATEITTLANHFHTLLLAWRKRQTFIARCSIGNSLPPYTSKESSARDLSNHIQRWNRLCPRRFLFNPDIRL